MDSFDYIDEYDVPCAPVPLSPHALRLAADTRIIADSALLGWNDLFASIAARRAWSGRIAPVEHLGFVYCLRGANRVERRIDGEGRPTTVNFQARELALLPSHASAHFHVRGEADVLIVYLRGAMVRAVADRLFGASTRPLHFQPFMAFRDPLLEQICVAFADALYRQRREETRYVEMLAESAAAHCLTRYAAGRPQLAIDVGAKADAETALGRVRAYVDDHLDGDLSLEALAREAALTPSALKRALATVHGATPKQWIIGRRIAHAQRMLASTDLPLAEIALQAGFSSQSHLSSLFKREIGRTPASYRRA